MQNCIAKVKKLILPCVEWVFHDFELDKNIQNYSLAEKIMPTFPHLQLSHLLFLGICIYLNIQCYSKNGFDCQTLQKSISLSFLGSMLDAILHVTP